MKQTLAKMLALMTLLAGVAACERQGVEQEAEGTGERVGEQIDSAAREAGPALERAGEALRNAGKETSDALRSAGNEIGEAMQRGGEKLQNESTESTQK